MINFEFMAEAFPQILLAVPTTLFMAFASAGIGWILGVFIALARKNKVKGISQILAVFVSFMRSVPMVILLYIAYYGIPIMLEDYYQSIGSSLTATTIQPIFYAIVALVLNQAAYSSEVFRAAIAAVDEGQMEAAYSVGMTKAQALFRIVFPQAMAIAIPNLGGLFVGLIKETSLAYYVGVYEITATANLLAMPSLNYIEAYLMTTVIYEALSFIFNRITRVLEIRQRRFRTQTLKKRHSSSRAQEAAA